MNLNELVTYIEELTFRTTMFGYDRDEVDVQLDKINDEIMALVKKKDDEIAALKSGAVIVEQADSGKKEARPAKEADAEKRAGEANRKRPGLFGEEEELESPEDSDQTLADPAEIEEILARNEELREEVSLLHDRIASLEGDLEQMTEQAEKAQADAREAAERIRVLEEHIQSLEEEKAILQARAEAEEDREDGQEADASARPIGEKPDMDEEEAADYEEEPDEDYEDHPDEEDEEDDEPAVLLVDEDTEETEEPERIVPGTTDEAYNQYMRNADLLCRQLSMIDDQKEGILNEARSEAEGIISQARDKADTVIEEANVQAGIIVDQANAEAENIRRGTEEEKKAILDEAYRERDDKLKNLQRDRALYKQLVEKKAAVLENLRKLSSEAEKLAGDYENPDYEALLPADQE